jgi:hypothetical protein
MVVNVLEEHCKFQHWSWSVFLWNADSDYQAKWHEISEVGNLYSHRPENLIRRKWTQLWWEKLTAVWPWRWRRSATMKWLLETLVASMRMGLWWLRIMFSACSNYTCCWVVAKPLLKYRWAKWFVPSGYTCTSLSKQYTHTIYLIATMITEGFKCIFHSYEPHPYASNFFFHSHEHSPHVSYFCFTNMNKTNFNEQHILEICSSQPRKPTICFKFVFHGRERKDRWPLQVHSHG